jgi:ubiquinone biosynthesis protein UbiJ
VKRQFSVNVADIFSFLPNQLKQLSLAAGLARALNHLLRQSPDLMAKAAPQAGKVWRLQVAEYAIAFRIEAGGLVDAAPDDAIAQAVISVPGSALLLILTNPEQAIAHAKVSGQADLAALVAHLFKHLRWHPEDDLADWVGEDAAVHGTALGRKAMAGLRDGWRRFEAAGREHLVHEKAVLVAKNALEGWAGEVRVLRDDVARLEKRIDRLLPNQKASFP